MAPRMGAHGVSRGAGLLRWLTLVTLLTALSGIRPAVILPAVPVAHADSSTQPTNLPVSFTAREGDPCSVGGSTLQDDGASTASVTVLGAGSCEIIASQPGNAQYNPADPVTQSFSIAPASTAISLSSISDTPYGDPVSLSATVTPSSLGPQQLTGSVTFSIDGDLVGSAPVNGSGVATLAPTVTQAPGSHTVTASFTSTNSSFANSDTTEAASFTVLPQSTTLTYTGDTTGIYDGTVQLAAQLHGDSTGTPSLSDRSVSFALGTQSCAGTTDNTGTATCTLILFQAPSSVTGVSASFAGDTDDSATATGTVRFTAAKAATKVAYTGPLQLAQGSTPTVTALLQETGGTVIAGRSVAITVGAGARSQHCTGTTSEVGIVTCQLPAINQTAGAAPISAAFAGDADYLASSDSSQKATVFAWPASGAYTVGDITAANAAGTSSTVTYWGGNWSSKNRLSRAPAPTVFFGFARTLASQPPRCGQIFTSTIPQSLTPPRNLPAYMGVAVVSSITRTRSNLVTGTISGLAVIKQSSAHIGTGTVVGMFCPAQAPQLTARSLAATREAGMSLTPADQAFLHAAVVAAIRTGSRPLALPGAIHPLPMARVPTAAGGTRSRNWRGQLIRRRSDAKQDQQIDFSSIADHTLGDAPFTISAESVTSQALPPNPDTVAPPLNQTVASNIYTDTSFLYTGNDPIQTGVAPGTIQETRITILRGVVNDGSGNPLPGATVTVLGHPEFGQTVSREDGRYDLAVNGGTTLTLTYTLDGYLPAQRQVYAPWDNYAQVDAVDMVPFDSHATPVTFSGDTTGIQVAQGSMQSDSSGNRQETVLVPPSETATMHFPDGSTQPLDSGHLRLTEFTVGDNGPDRMPAALPGSSAYTYAFAVSMDEEEQQGASDISFSQPMIAYNQNFLNWPVGAIVPIGEYDGSTGQWVADPNGVVIKILDDNNGEADLAVDSSGQAASDVEYQSLGITDAERAQLASMSSTYPVGTSLWRFTFTHDETDFDANAGTSPISLTSADRARIAALHQSNPNLSAQDIQKQLGQGTLDLQRQTMSEDRPVSGTPYTLHYASDRQNGFSASNTLHIPIPGDSDPNLKEVDVHLQVAGRDLVTVTDAGPVASCCATLTWDGKDAYGRPVNGEVPATVVIDYISVLPFEEIALFGGPLIGGARAAQRHAAGQRRRLRERQSCSPCDSPLGAPLFGLSPSAAGLNAVEAAGHIGRLATRQISYPVQIGHFDARGDGLGGWTLSVHHTYEPSDQLLDMGDGTTVSSQNLTQVIARIAGTGTAGDTGDGGPALQAQIDAGVGSAQRPADMAAGPDGSIYFVDFSGGTIRKIDPNGIITTVAGGGPGFGDPNGIADPTCATDVLGDGCQATDASLDDVYGMTVGPDGSIYFTERDFGAVRKITPNGIVHLIGGTVNANCLIICGSLGYTGDGVPAIGASLDGPTGIAVGPDGTVYFADTSNDRIRSIGTNGLINTLYDSGTNNLDQIAVGPDGSVYFEKLFDNIYRVDPSGAVSNVTGGSTNVPGIGNAGMNGLVVDQYGDIFFDSSPIGSICNNHIFEITPDGVEHDLGGSQYHFIGSCPPQGDGGAATQSIIVSGAMTVTPDGAIYESDGPTIRKISAPLPGVGHQGYLIPSPDGSQLYSFDASGKQQQTLDALTGAVLLTFGYDPATGFLTSITDANGNVTTIQHDASGNPTSITAPFGQVTTLTTDANGYLASISDPLHETTTLATTSTGLLTSITGPDGNAFTQSYDDLGRLTGTTNPGGGGSTLTGGDSAIIGLNGHLQSSYGVTATTAEGRKSNFSTTTLDDGTDLVQTILPDGTRHVRTQDVSLNNTITDPAGNTSATQSTADPRLGITASLPGTQSMKTPSGLTETTSTGRSDTLADPTNPLSLINQTTDTSVNGNTYTEIYTANTDRSTGGIVTDTSPLGRTATTTVDGQDRTVSTQRSNLAPIAYSYTGRGQLAQVVWGTGNNARTTTYAYGSDGRLASVTDPAGRVVRYTYDAAGHMLVETLSGSHAIHFAYNGDGDLTSFTAPGGEVWQYQYNGVDQITSVIPPDAGNGNPAITFTYNADRQLTQISRSDGQNIGFTYDPTSGNLTGTTIPQGSYADSYNASGLLSGLTAPGGMTTSYSYDGSLPTGMSWSGPVSGSVSRGYDDFFRPSSDSVSGGMSVSYGYDNDGLQTTAGDLSITHNPVNGLITGTSLGSITTNDGYDGFGEPIDEQTTANNQTLYGESYARDSLDRIADKTETIGGATHTYTYSYDLQTGRLIQVQEDGNIIESYSYDADGNRLTGPGVTTPATYDEQGELTRYANTSYSYDVAGNRASQTNAGGTTKYIYDPLGNLRSVTLPNSNVITYLVDGEGERIGKEVNGTLIAGYLYNQDSRIVALLDGSNAVRSQFVYAAGGTTPCYLITGGTEYRIVSDGTGSPRLVVNAATGQVMEEIDYDSFGNATISDVANGWDTSLLPFGFGGGLTDSDTGLIHLGLRDYDPVTGTWTSRDPLGFGSGDTNLYSYAADDPINLADPSGAGPFSDGQQDLQTQIEVFAGNHNVAWTVTAAIGLSVIGGGIVASTGVPAAIGGAAQYGWQLTAGVVTTTVVYPAYAGLSGGPSLGSPSAVAEEAEQSAAPAASWTPPSNPPPGDPRHNPYYPTGYVFRSSEEIEDAARAATSARLDALEAKINSMAPSPSDLAPGGPLHGWNGLPIIDFGGYGGLVD